jgi:hypothetical protein
MSYNQLHGYLVKDNQVKVIEGNRYDNPEGANGYFTLKSFRKYTWTSPDYHVELEFHGTYKLWTTEYNESNIKYARSYRKRNVNRSLKSLAEYLIKDYLKIIDTSIQMHNVSVKKVTLKTKGV